MRDEVEERDAAKDDERVGYFESVAVEEGECDEGWAEGHEKEEEGWWVFGAVQEGEEGEERGLLRRPWDGVAVEVDCAEDDERQRRGDAGVEENLLAGGGFEQKDSTEAEAEGHDGDPGDERIAYHEDDAVEDECADLMEDVPEGSVGAEVRDFDTVQAVVQDDGGDAEDRQQTRGDVDERG